MTLWQLLLGTLGHLVLVVLSGLMIIFSAPTHGPENAKLIQFLDISILAVPLISLLFGVIPWIGYFSKWSTTHLWWFAMPVPLLLIFMVIRWKILA